MDGGWGLEGERRRRRVAIPTCLLLSLLGGRRLGAARTGSLSVVRRLLSVILSPGSAVVWLGAGGRSRTPSGGHLRCGCGGQRRISMGRATCPMQPWPWPLLTLLLVVLLPGFRVVLLWGCTGLLRLLACGNRAGGQGCPMGGPRPPLCTADSPIFL